MAIIYNSQSIPRGPVHSSQWVSQMVDSNVFLLQDGRSPYFGAVVGRVANRIAKGIFTLEGRTYKLATNNGPNALHGGKRGFDKVIWQGARISHPDGDALRLTYTSRDGEEVRTLLSLLLLHNGTSDCQFREHHCY